MDKLLEYLVVTDQVDDFLGLKNNGVCPNCGSELVEILYGSPTYEVFEEVKEKKLYLGGCMVSDNDPKYHCYECSRNYYENGKRAR